MKKIILVTLINTLALAAMATPIYHGPSNKIIEWWKPANSAQVEVYVPEQGEYVYKTIPMTELSLFEEGTIDHVKAGKMVLFEIQGELRACKVSHLFQNGKTFAFCDYFGMTKHGERVLRTNVEGTATQFIGETKSSSDVAILKANFKYLKAGTRVIVRAVFVNGLSLIQKDSLENRLIQGPRSHAGSLLVPTDLLK